MNEEDRNSNLAILAYITLIGWIVAFILNMEKKNKLSSYHIRQSLGLMITGLLLGVIGSVIPLLGLFVSIIGSILLIVLWIIGVMNAVNKNEKPVPLLGKKFEEWFSNLN